MPGGHGPAAGSGFRRAEDEGFRLDLDLFGHEDHDPAVAPHHDRIATGLVPQECISYGFSYGFLCGSDEDSRVEPGIRRQSLQRFS